MGNRFVYPDASCTRFTRRVWNMDIWKKKMIAMVILIPYARWTSATSRLERENNTSPPPTRLNRTLNSNPPLAAEICRNTRRRHRRLEQMAFNVSSQCCDDSL
ncbi:hypothetical protein CEP51_014038 [Fusarium floridanum]|uniref:Uncharacterized protein n=1 Tax=Fusarium floridanum TaxID=1325733 RepID=A0A428Q051_9HYPO|nr:hypothetical protein CEP51_014038 [Fusarium floridanum]